ncbi:hypothetical protein OMO38_05285 [Chryseobacterium sp. 09-1422]|uniref:Uncharacterized protein n=1 Tax=Chryseobacterium kimseyorum TaxID=2984028 RepID=A0ABT3HVX3_9FLAO|nr:hypothetical protein [Chryseobacterium kimseyorum]MCW3167936.1 hypothetical protein [Chryseobacterium kimseyorum]
MYKNIPQLATVKISCNEVGTAVIYFPDPNVDYVYVLTAKHCLTGKNFDKDFEKTDIILENIFNEEQSQYYSYNLTDSDIVHISENNEDIALLILLKKNILPLTGKQFFCQVIDTDETILEYEIRGFAGFNDQEADRSFKLKFDEDQKDNRSRFILRSESSLDTFYQQALENVEGLSGSGAYSVLFGSSYFTGIVHSYENNGIFLATKALAYNKLIPQGFNLIKTVKPETDQQVLSSYEKIETNEHTVNARTREKIGNFNVPRDATDLLKSVKNNSVTVVHGNPGVGKSALTKFVVADMKASREYSILTFTAENLYCETLAEALANVGSEASIPQLMASPLLNKYLLIWIESFEKLIESNFSGAFNELLQLLSGNKNVSIILTIRDYILQKFKINYQFELPESISYFQVNEFNDQEIELIRTEFPELRDLLDNPKIEHLLRNPYYLDKAVRIIPQLLREELLDELQFKRLMWEHIVENNNPKRGTVFLDICLKRSEEMSLFTAYVKDAKITADLVKDNILQIDKFSNGNTFSPSHDILEDWALVRFIRQQKTEAAEAKDFILSIESSPAMKRAFRLWLEDYYTNEPVDSVNFVHKLLNDSALKQSWKNELLIVSLRSNHSNILLDSLKNQFLINSGQLLKDIMFLLQTGCKKINPATKDFNHLLPVGSGWDYIIDYIKENSAEIKSIEGFQARYLNLIEAWSQQLPNFNQKLLPPSAKSAAFLLEDFIYHAQSRTTENRLNRSGFTFLKKYVAIFFKLTAADPELVRLLVEAIQNPGIGNARWTNTAILFAVRDLVVDGVNADQICRFFPDAVFQMARENWAKKEERHQPGSLNSMIVRQPKFDDFGLNENIDHHYKNPSGYQTFFYWMFLYYPEKALDFIIPFLNTAFNHNQEVLNHLNREIENINIVFEDGTHRQYYGNYDYWTMYRGSRVLNDVVSSLLMGLEKSLLDIIDGNKPNSLNQYLARIIKESNNVAVLGVVSSVLQADPSLLDELSASLLGVPSFFKWDSSRSTHEMIDRTVFNTDPFERKERIQAIARKHRTKYNLGLIGFVVEYLFYQRNHNKLIFKQIDKMWQSTSGDLISKKFLFDMDVRKYEFKPIDQQGYEYYIQLTPDYDEDIQKMIKNPEEYPKVTLIWARDAFDNKVMPNHNYATWKVGYNFIIGLNGRSNPMVAPGTMAAVALRDFLEDLTPEELIWCQNTLLNFACRKLGDADPDFIDFDALDNGPTLTGLSFLFKTKLDLTLELEAKKLIFNLLLAKLDDNESIAFQQGLSQYLSTYQPQFVMNCWFGLMENFRRTKGLNDEYKRRKELYHQGKLTADELQNIQEDWTDELVTSVVNGTIQEPAQISVVLEKSTYRVLEYALRIISWKTESASQQQFIQDILEMHLDFLKNPHLRNYPDFFESRAAFIVFYPRYLLNQPRIIADPLFNKLLNLVLDFNEKEYSAQFLIFIKDMVEEFIVAVYQGADVGNFWFFWECLRTWTVSNKKIFFIPPFLMDIKWSANMDQWNVLEGKNLYYKEFIENWGSNMVNESIRFISGIAFHNFMPDSISWIAILLYSKGEDIDTDLLEKFVENAFHKYGGKIKQNQEILLYFLFILEFLIRRESPRAYMLKDELLQYKVKI